MNHYNNNIIIVVRLHNNYVNRTNFPLMKLHPHPQKDVSIGGCLITLAMQWFACTHYAQKPNFTALIE